MKRHFQRFDEFALPCVLVLALLLRVYLLFTVLEPIEGDEAVIGLMAQHIRYGARTLFDYDISYHGPLESYLTAPLFALFGMNRFVLRIVPLAFSLAFVWAVYWLGDKLYDRKVGLCSALYAAIPPSMLTIWGLKAGAGYIVVLVLGVISLTLAADLQRRASLAKTLVLLLALALGFWVQYVMGYYIAAIVLAIASGKILRANPVRSSVPNRSQSCHSEQSPLTGVCDEESQPRSAETLSEAKGDSFLELPRPVNMLALVLAVGALLGACHLVSLMPQVPPLADFLRSLVGLFTTAFPVLLGFLQPSVSNVLFSSQVAERGAFYAFSVGFSIAVCLAVLWAGARRVREGDNLLLLFVAATVVAFGAFFTIFHVSLELVQEPRYLLPLYSAIPLGILALLRLAQRPAWLRPALLGGILTLNLWSNLTIQPALNLPYVHGETLADYQALIDWLDAKNIRHVYTDYWIGYPLAFESQERIVPFVITHGDQIGWNRHPPYVAEVERSPNPAYIFVTGSEDEGRFVDYLMSQNIKYKVESIAPYAIYWNLSSRVHFPLRLPASQSLSSQYRSG